EGGAHGRGAPVGDAERLPRARPAERRAPLALVTEDAVRQHGTDRAEREPRDAGLGGEPNDVIVAGLEQEAARDRAVELDSEGEDAALAAPALEERAGDGSAAIVEEEEPAVPLRLAEGVRRNSHEEIAEPASRVGLVQLLPETFHGAST